MVQTLADAWANYCDALLTGDEQEECDVTTWGEEQPRGTDAGRYEQAVVNARGPAER
jgi:hypothetical protein